MKKYIAPTMDVMEIEAANLLAASDPNNAVNTTLGDDTPNDVTFHSRKFSIWSSDEEE